MKYGIIAITSLVIALMISGCSGASKKAESSAPPTAAPATATQPPSAKAKKEAPAAAPGSKITCKYDNIIRELVVDQSPDRCVVQYTKDGTTQEIATGSSGSAYCQEVADRVKNNLVAAGYECK
jgi:PBP1b-binding outer membrane lipoprotein LpoB